MKACLIFGLEMENRYIGFGYCNVQFDQPIQSHQFAPSRLNEASVTVNVRL